jgi:peptidoglycan-associated lipoprotein
VLVIGDKKPYRHARTKYPQEGDNPMNALVKITLVAALLAVAGCAKDKARPAGDTAGDTSGTTTTPLGGSGDISSGSTSTAGRASLPSVRTIYFAFDSSEITGEGQAVVDGWAAYLSANPSARIKLEGHCDERGTREYNIALGERRANAVLQAMASRGVAERQVSVTSYGEERPVSSGHDEAAWQQNRRVEIAQ